MFCDHFVFFGRCGLVGTITNRSSNDPIVIIIINTIILPVMCCFGWSRMVRIIGWDHRSILWRMVGRMIDGGGFTMLTTHAVVVSLYKEREREYSVFSETESDCGCIVCLFFRV